MSTQRRQLTLSGSIPSLFPCRRCASSMRREQVVGRADRVDVAREVEVHVLHRDDLRVAAARGAALDPEDGAERGLAQAEHGVLADVPEPLRQGDRRGRLALARLGRRDRGDVDQLAVGAVRETVEDREGDLGLVPAVGVVLVLGEPESLRDLGDGAKGRLLCDLQAARHCGHGAPSSEGQCETAAAASSDTRVSVWKRSSANGAISLGVSPVATSSASVVPTIGAALKP